MTNENLTTDAVLEAILWYEGGEVTKKMLKKTLDWDAETLARTITELSTILVNRGVTLIETEETLSLRVAPTCADTVALFDKGSNDREIGKAGLEVLSILLYRGPSTQSEIDYIRGVNSSTTLRALTIRGLITHAVETTGRGKPYIATDELLAHLGITHESNLQNTDDIKTRINTFETASQI